MITALFLLSVSTPSPMPLSLMEEIGYKLRDQLRKPRENQQGFSQSATFDNALGEKTRIRTSWLSAKSHANSHFSGLNAKQRHKYLDGFYTVEPYLKRLPSNLPPVFARTTKGKTVSLQIMTSSATVTCSFEPIVSTTAKGFADPQPYDFPAKARFLERIARHTLATAAGLRLDGKGTETLAGKKLAAAECRRSGRKFGDLNQWIADSGWIVSEDKSIGILNLKKGSDWAVLPLGADQIKVNGVWKEMGDSAAFFNGKLYLPETGLKHLREA